MLRSGLAGGKMGCQAGVLSVNPGIEAYSRAKTCSLSPRLPPPLPTLRGHPYRDVLFLLKDTPMVAKKRNPVNQHPASFSDEPTKLMAKIIAMTVRNEMEDFHVKHLSDAQMKELNPIIRNAIYTTLYAFQHPSEAWCQQLLDFQKTLIPETIGKIRCLLMMVES